jgi:dephospho-CoA kinase
LKLIGLTGGAGSGKSTVSRMFGQLGAAVVDADEAAHAVYEPGMPAFDDIVSAFGPEYVGDDGRVDRARLGDLVFRDEEARKRLNAIVHPRVRDWMAERTVDAFERGAEVVLQDVPLLFENGLQGLYSKTILVYARPAIQVARLVGERGITRERAERMVASQMPIEDKKALADFVIDNEGSIDDSRRQVEEVWARVRAL